MKQRPAHILLLIISMLWICCTHMAIRDRASASPLKNQTEDITDTIDSGYFSHISDAGNFPDPGFIPVETAEVPSGHLERHKRQINGFVLRQMKPYAGESLSQTHYSVYNLSKNNLYVRGLAKDHYIFALRQLII